MLAMAYRMLGDLSRSEDIVQEAWLRWQGRRVAVEAPKAYLLQIVTRLCLNELSSARARREELRSDRLPEPIDGEAIDRLETLDRISMAFIVVLQRLSPAERAVLLLHDVFELPHAEIARMLDRKESACRKLLHRAKRHVRVAERMMHTSQEEHAKMVQTFVEAASSGRLEAFSKLLCESTVLVADAGPRGGRFGKVRNLAKPIVGPRKILAFIGAIAKQETEPLDVRFSRFNASPAALILQGGTPHAAITVAGFAGRVHCLFVHADPERLPRASS